MLCINKLQQAGGGRNVSVDFLKFLAAIFVINSHSEILYPGRWSVMATGGSIGDALFFFCSGFTLFLKPMDGISNFLDWYKKRINRIYPTIFAVAIVSCAFFNGHSDILTILFHSGWFVSCIMVYYIIIYIIGSYFREKILPILLLVLLATAFWFFIVYGSPGFSMYMLETSNICLLFYFMFMLLGAEVGKKAQNISTNSILDPIVLLFSLVAFYALLIAGTRIEMLRVMQLFSLLPLIAIVFYAYKTFCGNWAEKLYNNKVIHFVIRFVGGLCLEIYLVQYYLLTDKLNGIFPLNIIVIVSAIMVMAYLTRCLARIFGQTFKDEPYNWKKIFELY